MGWFRRSNQDSYMQNTQTVSRPVGIVLTILMVLAVAAAVYVLFLGGRWIFQNLDGSNVPKAETVSVEETSQSPQSPGSTSSDGNGSATSSASNSVAPSPTPTATPANSSTSANSTGSGNQIAASGPTATNVGSQNTTAATTITASGPTEVLGVFIAVALFGLIAHNIVLRIKFGSK